MEEGLICRKNLVVRIAVVPFVEAVRNEWTVSPGYLQKNVIKGQCCTANRRRDNGLGEGETKEQLGSYMDEMDGIGGAHRSLRNAIPNPTSTIQCTREDVVE